MFCVLTNRDDVHADSMIAWLCAERPDVEIVRINTDEAFEELVSTRCAEGSHINVASNGKSIGFSADDVFWLRRPKKLKARHIANPYEASFSESQFEALLNSIYSISEMQSRWVNPPSAARRSANKLFQLHIAAACGLNVPNYLATTCKSRIASFFEREPLVCIKSLTIAVFEKENRTLILYTRLIGPDEAIYIAETGGAFGPVFLQRYIRKQFEVRVVVFGPNIHAFELRHEHGSVDDVRQVLHDDVTSIHIDVSDQLKQKIRKFTDILGICFASMDFVVDSDGKWWFLEANPNGQWMWLEFETGVPLRASFAEAFL